MKSSAPGHGEFRKERSAKEIYAKADKQVKCSQIKKEVWAVYEKVMVPLDGSPLAECVLDHVKSLAAIGQINQLLLLGVVETPPDWAKEGPAFDSFENEGIAEKKSYLTRVKDDLVREGISNVSIKVLVGRPADLITESAQKEGAVLIAIATHGRTGLGKWMLGSVAYKVMRYSQVPVFMVRPDSCRN